MKEGDRLKNVGFIGTGNMGTILIEAFLEARAFTPENVHITNRTIEKAIQIATKHKGIHVHEDVTSLIKTCDWIFLCVRPLQIFPIIREVRELLTKEKTVISITSPILVSELQLECDARVVRFVPSIVNRALEGPSLVTFGDHIEEKDRKELFTVFSSISRPEMIEDSTIRIASDLASCGPAFFSFFIEKYVDAAVKETNIHEDDATQIVEAMLIGYGELLKKKIYNLETLREKVTVKGGITGEGLKVLQAEIRDLFHLLIRATHKKFEEDRLLIQQQLKNESKE